MDTYHVDLLIKNGRVLDPYNNIDQVKNIGVKNSKIVELSNDFVSDNVIDADNCLVVPGLIDYHGHVNWNGSYIGIHPDLCTIPNGVTAIVDCGCTGVNNYKSLLDRLSSTVVKSKIYINVSPLGQSSDQFTELLKPETWKEEAFASAFELYGDKILGLKVRISKKIVGELGITTLIKGEEIAEKHGKNVMIHPTDPPVKVKDFIDYLRTGDVYCHVFNNYGHTILDEQGNVEKKVWDAKERGVLFDMAHGGMNFSWEVAEKAAAQGFYPNLIGSDTTTKTWNSRPIYNLPNVMTKALHIGMPLYDVIKAVTSTAAKAMHMDGEWGCLSSGSAGDITILKIKKGSFPLYDARGKVRMSDKLLIPLCTISNGKIVYRNPEFIN